MPIDLRTLIMMLLVGHVIPYSKVVTDNDLYGTKVAINDLLCVSADNIFLIWYVAQIAPHNTKLCTISYNITTCDFVYSILVPTGNSSSLIYNCIDLQGNNVVGFLTSNYSCNYQLENEVVIPNYSTQDNFIIAIDGSCSGVYGFADDFVFYYELRSPFQLTVWPNTLNISPRGIDIGSNDEYGVVVGYCQVTAGTAYEYGLVIRLNQTFSSPLIINSIQLHNAMNFNYSDPRYTHRVSNSCEYSSQTILSVSITWRTRRILIGVPLLNIVLLYSFDDVSQPISTRQNGIGISGYGKSVAWLNDQDQKAVILANSYVYSTNQWISSSVHLYDVESDGLSDITQPILVYPNSQQVKFSGMNPIFLRIICSNDGNLAIFDYVGIAVGIFSAPLNTYPDTTIRPFRSIAVPCIPGTYRNYSGIELCIPCPNGTFSSACTPCQSNDSFCPYGSVEDIPYSAIYSIEQDFEYPESPENVVFDDLLLQNMFSFNWKSSHCVIVSPMTWVLVVIVLGFAVALSMTFFEFRYANTRAKSKRAKEILKKLDLIGDGELWIGGLVSAGIIVLMISSYVFSNSYFRQYPIETATSESSFACDTTLRNAKFSTTMHMLPQSNSLTRQNQPMFNLLNTQLFNLKIDLIQTAFTCDDSITVRRIIANTMVSLPITKCESSFNGSIVMLTVPLPTQIINVQLILPGLRTVGGIRIGLTASSMLSDDGRYTLLELNFASTFLPTFLNQVLNPSTTFGLQMTPIINETDPLSVNGLSTYSAIWSSSFSVKTDELFSNETRYTFFQRMQTNVTINIDKTVFYVSNVQQPIARQPEIIFRNLLFTIVVLEVFGLIFLIVKALILPIFRIIAVRLQPYLRVKQNKINLDDELDMIVINKTDSLTMNKLPPITKIPQP